MNHLDLFAGIGGFSLAASWMGWETIAQVEWDEWCQKVLAKNFPDVLRFGDIVEFNKMIKNEKNKIKPIDIITGGFPCQPFSHAGKRKGTNDSRYLWPAMFETIRRVKPTYVVGENVTGLISMENGKTLDGILTDLENEGYVTEQIVIPACAVKTWHKRDRLWILAYSVSQRGCGRDPEGKYAENARQQPKGTGHGRGNPLPEMGGVVNGIPNWMDRYWDQEPNGVPRVAIGVKDRVKRLRGLGNAIVPQVAFEIFKIIQKISNEDKNN